MAGGKKRVTVGHSISLGVLAKFCHGPIDRITQFFFDDKVAATGSWDGTPNDQPYYPAPSHGQSVIISANGLFGGDNGGVYGRAIIRMGDKDQPVNELFTTSEFTGQDEVSADRGVVSVLYTNWGGKPNGYYAAPWSYQFYWGNRPQLPRFGIRAQRIHVQDGGIPQWYDEKAEVSVYSFRFDYDNEWKYKVVPASSGGAPGIPSEYISPEYDDSAWSVGAGAFGSEAPAGGFPINTPVSAGEIGKGIWIRKTFEVERPDVIGDIIINVYHDDGAWLWWNGEPIDLESISYFNSIAKIPSNKIKRNNVAAMQVLDGIPGGTPINIYAGLDIATFGIDVADMNPVHAIRERLVSKICGLDMPEAALDDAQLKHCADILHAEGMGVSFLWDRSKPVSELIEDICFHIDALYPQVDRRTGLLYLPLVRDDYDRDNVFVLDTTNIVKIEDYKRPAQSDLFNTIVVKYNDLEAKKEMSITRSDPALLKMQGGIRAKDYNMYFFSNYQTANKAAIRLLRAATKRIRTCTAYCDRSAASLRPGDVVRMFYDAPEFEGVIMRVLGVRYGTGRDQQVTLLLSEDIYDFDASAVQTEDEPVDIPNLTGDLEPITKQRAFELPYYEMAQNLGDVEAYELTSLYPEVGYIGAVAGNPASFIDAKLHVDSGTGYEEIGAVEYSPGAILAADMGLVNPDGSIVELAEVVDAGTIGGARVGSYFMINDECIRFDGIDIDGKVMMGRGCLDTVPAEHPAGSVMFFADDMLEVINEQYIDSETVAVKLLPNTGSQILDINDATAMSVTMASRAARPYLPGDVKINGEYFPAQVAVGDIVVTWSHRDRTQQTTGAIIDFTAGDIGPEDSVEYEVKNFDDETDVELYDSGLTTSSSVIVPLSCVAVLNRLEIKSFRNSMESFYKYAIRFRAKVEMLGDLVGGANSESYSSRIYVDDPTMSLAYPLKWAIAGGSLPAGLTLLHSGAGEAFVSGIPNDATGYYQVDVVAEDATGYAIIKSFEFGVGNLVSNMDFEGADGSTTITDRTGRAWSRFGNAKLATTGALNGVSSLSLDGSGDYLSTASTTDINLSTAGDFSISCRVKTSNSKQQAIFSKRSSGDDEFGLEVEAGNGARRVWFAIWKVPSIAIAELGASVDISSETHIAIERVGSVYYMHINGEIVDYVTASDTLTSTTNLLTIGRSPRHLGRDFDGLIDDFRFIRGATMFNGKSAEFDRITTDYPASASPVAVKGSLPAGAEGVAYSSLTDLSIVGSGTPFTVSVTDGALPSGWTATVNGNYIEVAGAGVAAGRYYFTLEVEDASANVFALPLVVAVE